MSFEESHDTTESVDRGYFLGISNSSEDFVVDNETEYHSSEVSSHDKPKPKTKQTKVKAIKKVVNKKNK